MGNNLLEKLRSDIRQIFGSAVEAADPFQSVRAFVRLEGNRLHVGREQEKGITLDLDRFDRISLIGGGKASAPMAQAIEEILGSRVAGGLLNVKYGFSADLSVTAITEAGHPLPDANGVAGTRKILDFLESAGERDLILSLISGGGSALLPQPAGSISLEEKQALTRSLLACGASIDEINAVRKHISLSKGGQMARAAYPATTVNLMLSDVVGDKMDVIGSGPFVPDSSTYADVWKIFEKYDLKEIPAAIAEHLRAGLEGRIPETPKLGEKVFDRVHNFVVGSNILALSAAEERAKALGYRTLILSSSIEGETREVARVHTAIAKEILATGRPIPAPACIVTGGETTVTVRGSGLGGRNQEFCLAAAADLVGLSPRVAILSGGTDGNDGPTDAAGGIVDPFTAERGTRAGIEIADHLARNDSYRYLEKTGDLLITGPTRTNVMDVRLVLVGKD